MAMHLRQLLRGLEAVARDAGAPVRYESLRLPKASDGARAGEVGRGGLVRLGDRALIVCDERLPLVDKVFVVAEALGRLDVTLLHLPPLLAARLAHRRGRPFARPRRDGA
jgi:hypothetical protein